MGLPRLPLSGRKGTAAQVNQSHHHLHAATSLWNRLRSWPRDVPPPGIPSPETQERSWKGREKSGPFTWRETSPEKGWRGQSLLHFPELRSPPDAALGPGLCYPLGCFFQREVSFRGRSCVKNSTDVWRSCLGLSPRSTIYGQIIYHGSRFPNLKSGMTTNSPLFRGGCHEASVRG